MTQPQMEYITSLQEKLGWSDKELLAYIREQIGVSPDSLKKLPVYEASSLIDLMKQELEKP